MNYNQIVISLSCSDLEKREIVDSINLFLNGEFIWKKEDVYFIELNNKKRIEFKDWFIYAILMIGVEPISKAITNSIKGKELTLKFIDINTDNEFYTLQFSNKKYSLLEDFKHLSRKEIAENFIKEIKEKTLKQELSELFTEKQWVRNFARNKFNELDKKIDLLPKKQDLKILASFLYPLSEALKDNKKPIIREYIKRLILAELALNKEVTTDILEFISINTTSKKKKRGLFRKITNTVVLVTVSSVLKEAIGISNLDFLSSFDIDVSDIDEIG